jgi:hypothetical protein
MAAMASEGHGPILTLSELRTVLARILDQIETQFGPQLDLDGGLYWSLESGTAYSLSEAAGATITAGDLVDDVQTIREILTRDPPEIYVWHDLEHVIGVLGRIADLDQPRGRVVEQDP